MSLRTDYFLTWTPFMAFDAGYVTADGCITTDDGRPRGLKLGCQTRDEEVILGIRDRLGSHHSVHRDSVRRSTSVCIYSKRLAESLIRCCGILPRKSFLDLAFPDVPDEFLPHFVRGYLTGDGCVSRSKRGQTTVSFFGTRSFIAGLADRINAATGVSRKNVLHIRRTTYAVLWSRRTDLEILYAWLFPPGHYPCLRRKRDLLAAAVLR
jgi:hypothetical protein